MNDAKAILTIVLLLALPVGAALWLWPAHGLLADYRVVVNGEPVACVQVTDTDLYFAKRQLFNGPVQDHWRFDRHGDNREVPALNTVWSGWLRVPRTGEYRFSAESPGRLRLTIGDEALALRPKAPSASVHLKKGLRRFTAEYQGQDGPQLRWQIDRGPSRPVRWTHFYWQRPAPWAKTASVAAFAWLLLIEIIGLARWRPQVTERALRFVETRGAYVVLAALVLLVLTTRLYRYDRMPYTNETADEYNLVHHGLSLVYTGRPSSWSQLPAYRPPQTEFRRIFGEGYTFVTPFFDHPPGLAWLVGLYARAIGVRYEERYEHFVTAPMRLPPIALSAATAVLLFFFAARVFGRRDLALLAVAFYASYPTAAYAGRLLKEENFLVAIFLAVLLLTWRYLRTESRAALLAAALLAGLGCTFKVTALAIVGSAVAMLLLNRRWRAALVVATIGAAGFGLYFLWGAYEDWDTFWRVFQNMQTRQYAVQRQPALSTRGLWSLLVDNGAATVKFGSLTHLWFWLAFAVFGYEHARRRNETPAGAPWAIWPLAIYLAFMAIAISSDKSFGWYRVPMLPFLAIAAAWFVRAMWRDGSVMAAASLCLLPLVDNGYRAWLAPAIEHPFGLRVLIVGPLALLFATCLLPEDKRRTAVRVFGTGAVLVLFVAMTVAIVNHWYVYRLDY